MKGIGTAAFPALMVLGLALSAFVIVTSLEAAAVATVQPVSDTATIAVSRETMVGLGRALFLSKGCIVCHQNDKAMASSLRQFQFDDIPNLTNIKIDKAYLRRWLHDPKAVKPGTEMPNLNLSDGEVDALVAFLQSE